MVYDPLYTPIQDGDDGTANSVNSRLTEISNAVGQLGDGTDPVPSPDITSFVNSNHDHSDAASGGVIPFDNLDTSGATAGQKWIADGVGGGSWVSGYPFISAIAPLARISDVLNQWLRCDGRTIGSATSGATARANADVEDLFTHLWAEFTNTQLPIQDSGGTPTSRGASAAADWGADKRMPLPDFRGRVLAGMDDPTGADAAGRITDVQADAMGGWMGDEEHVLTTAELASHTHGMTTYSADPSGNNDTVLATQNKTPSGFAPATTATGNGTAHNNVQPTIFMNYFIYTGN